MLILTLPAVFDYTTGGANVLVLLAFSTSPSLTFSSTFWKSESSLLTLLLLYVGFPCCCPLPTLLLPSSILLLV